MRISTRRCYRVFNTTEHEQNLTNVTILCSNRLFLTERWTVVVRGVLPKQPSPASLASANIVAAVSDDIDGLHRYRTSSGDPAVTTVLRILTALRTDLPALIILNRILPVSLDDRWLRDSDGTSEVCADGSVASYTTPRQSSCVDGIDGLS